MAMIFHNLVSAIGKGVRRPGGLYQVDLGMNPAPFQVFDSCQAAES